MQEAGIDPAATIGGKPRFIWRTWGQHEGDSEFSYARNVVLCGVLHRSRVELAGAMVGELDDLEAKISDGDIAQLIRSEKAHCVYQALSRGACRIVRSGVAEGMRALILDRSPKLREDTAAITPGISWKIDGEEAPKLGQKSRPLAERIADHLQRLAPDVRRISVRVLMAALGQLGVAPNTATRAIHQAAAVAAWVPVGRSLIRTA